MLMIFIPACSESVSSPTSVQAETVEKGKPQPDYSKVNVLRYTHASSATYARNSAQSAMYTFDLEVIDIVKDGMYWFVFVAGDDEQVDAWMDQQMRCCGGEYHK